MPMKRLITLLSVALPVLLSGCSDEEDILPEQREKIVSYLERTHTPTLVSEAEADEEGQLPFYTTAGSSLPVYHQLLPSQPGVLSGGDGRVEGHHHLPGLCLQLFEHYGFHVPVLFERSVVAGGL